MPLNPSQLATLRQCAEEECSVIELLQELQIPGVAPSDIRPLLVAALCELAREEKIEFFLDEFAASSIRSITIAAALLRLADDATWDMHNQTQLHVSWCEA